MLCYHFFLDYYKACEGQSKTPMSVHKILNLRKDTSSLYYDFIEYFVSAVVGKNHYNSCRSYKLLSEFTTVSDEALAILIYENNIDTWKDMANRKITKNSNVSRKYTNGGSTQGQVGSSRKYQGWSSSGMIQFNELYNLVEEDCESLHAKAFEESFLDFCVNGGVNGKKKKPTKLLYETIVICHSLWSEPKILDNNGIVNISKTDLSVLHSQDEDNNSTEEENNIVEHGDSDEDEDPYGNIKSRHKLVASATEQV